MNTVLWTHDKRKTSNYTPLIAIIDFAIISLGIFIFFNINFHLEIVENLVSITQTIALIGAGVLHFYLKTLPFIYAETAKYSLTENGIEFEWGLFKRRTEKIPYKYILKSVLIQHGHRSYVYSIVLFPMCDIIYRGYDHLTNKIRCAPAFEKILDGENVQKILRAKIAEDRNKDTIEDFIEEVQLESKGIQTVNHRLWNIAVALVYFGYFSLYSAVSMDLYLMESNYIDDTIALRRDNVDSKGNLLETKYITEKGNKYLLYDIVGSNGSEITLVQSKIFKINQTVILQHANGKIIEEKTVIFHTIYWVISLIAFYLLLSGIKIFNNKGSISNDEKGILYIGPILTILLAYLLVYMSTN